MDLAEGKYIRLAVRDSGRGIAPDILERIFDPYFTTKQVGEGTGMGLAVVHGIIRNYGGAISVISEPGAGTCFRIYLPLIDSSPSALKEPGTNAELPTGNERVLFVDDEDHIVEVSRQMLKWLGYQVSAFLNPMEALEIFRGHPDRFDLVITDMTMPKMTGDTLVSEILAIRPDIPVIMCTGYSNPDMAEKIHAIGIRVLISKPYTLRDLAVAVRKVLEERN